jgi:uncharacterized membrane protein YjjB (DUF3815 family)
MKEYLIPIIAVLIGATVGGLLGKLMARCGGG